MATRYTQPYPPQDWASVAASFKSLAMDPGAHPDAVSEHGLGQVAARPHQADENPLKEYFHAVLDVVDHLMKSGLAEHLFARQSLYFLLINNVESDMCGLAFEPGKSAAVRLTYIDQYPHTSARLKAMWSHEYSADEVVAAVHRFVERTGWFQTHHPAMNASAALLTRELEAR